MQITWPVDPGSNSDFTTDVSGSSFPALFPGHECYAVPNPPSNILSGSNATLQLKYISQFDTSNNQTFYACADITYARLSDFTTQIPCFNVSTENPSVVSSQIGSATGIATSTSGVSTSTVAQTTAKPLRHSRLSGGAIAGIVIASVIGGALILGVAYFLWRRMARRARHQKAVELRMDELTNPVK